MKAPRLLASIATVAISLALTTVPASANEAPVIDYCAKKTTGKIRAITEAGPIVRGETHPSALVPQFKARYEAAKAAAKKKGHTLAVTSGYRSLERQEMLYQRAIKRHGSAEAASKWVLPPEKSNHPWGIAIDINYGVGGTKGKKAAAWLEKNGYLYGLCRRYENEWWHFEPLVAPGQQCPVMEPYAS